MRRIKIFSRNFENICLAQREYHQEKKDKYIKKCWKKKLRKIFSFFHVYCYFLLVSISIDKVSSLFADVQQRYLRDLITIYERDRLIYNRANRRVTGERERERSGRRRWRRRSTSFPGLCVFFFAGIPKQADALLRTLFVSTAVESPSSVLSLSRNHDPPCNRRGSLIIDASGVYRWLTRW